MQRTLAALSLAILASCDDRGTGVTGVSPGLPAAQLVLLSQPANTQARVNIAAIQVAVRNSSGQTVTTSTASITATITPNTGTAGAVLQGTTTQVAASGVAMFNNLSIDRSGNGFTLTFSSTGLTSAVTTTFNVTQ